MVENSKLLSHWLRWRALSRSARKRRTRCSSTSSGARTRPTRPGMDLSQSFISYSLLFLSTAITSLLRRSRDQEQGREGTGWISSMVVFSLSLSIPLLLISFSFSHSFFLSLRRSWPQGFSSVESDRRMVLRDRS